MDGDDANAAAAAATDAPTTPSRTAPATVPPAAAAADDDYDSDDAAVVAPSPRRRRINTTPAGVPNAAQFAQESAALLAKLTADVHAMATAWDKQHADEILDHEKTKQELDTARREAAQRVSEEVRFENVTSTTRQLLKENLPPGITEIPQPREGWLGGNLQRTLAGRHAYLVVNSAPKHDFSTIPIRLPPQVQSTHPYIALDYRLCVATNVWDPMTQNPEVFRMFAGEAKYGFVCFCKGHDDPAKRETWDNDEKRRNRFVRKNVGTARYFPTADGLELFIPLRYKCRSCGKEMASNAPDLLRAMHFLDKLSPLKAAYPVVQVSGQIMGKSLVSILHSLWTQSSASFTQSVEAVTRGIRDSILHHQRAAFADVTRFLRSVRPRCPPAAGRAAEPASSRPVPATSGAKSKAKKTIPPEGTPPIEAFMSSDGWQRVSARATPEQIAIQSARNLIATIERADSIVNAVLGTSCADSWRNFMRMYTEWSSVDYLWIAENVSLNGFNVMCADHTFKLAKAVKVQNGVRYVAVFTVWNMRGEVLAQQFCQTQKLSDVKGLLTELQNRLKNVMFHGVEQTKLDSPLYFIVDNCCTMKNVIKESMMDFADDIYVKLDPYHWFRRWSRRIKLRECPEGRTFETMLRSTVFSKSAPGKRSRIVKGLAERLARLREDPVVSALVKRFPSFHQVFATLASHAPCLEEPEHFTDEEYELFRRNTNEQYHGLANRNARPNSQTTPANMAAALIAFNTDITLRRVVAKTPPERNHAECPIARGSRSIAMLSNLVKTAAEFKAACTDAGGELEDLALRSPMFGRFCTPAMQRLTAYGPSRVASTWFDFAGSFDEERVKHPLTGEEAPRMQSPLAENFKFAHPDYRKPSNFCITESAVVELLRLNILRAPDREGKTWTDETRPHFGVETDSAATVQEIIDRIDYDAAASAMIACNRCAREVFQTQPCGPMTLSHWLETAGLQDGILIDDESQMLQNLLDKVGGVGDDTSSTVTSMTSIEDLSFAPWSTKIAAAIALNYEAFGGEEMSRVAFGSRTTPSSRTEGMRADICNEALPSAKFAEVLVLVLRAVSRACDALIFLLLPFHPKRPHLPEPVAIVFAPENGEPEFVFALQISSSSRNRVDRISLPHLYEVACKILFSPSRDMQNFIEDFTKVQIEKEKERLSSAAGEEDGPCSQPQPAPFAFGDTGTMAARNVEAVEEQKKAESSRVSEHDTLIWGKPASNSNLGLGNTPLVALVGLCMLLGLRETLKPQVAVRTVGSVYSTAYRHYLHYVTGVYDSQVRKARGGFANTLASDLKKAGVPFWEAKTFREKGESLKLPHSGEKVRIEAPNDASKQVTHNGTTIVFSAVDSNTIHFAKALVTLASLGSVELRLFEARGEEEPSRSQQENPNQQGNESQESKKPPHLEVASDGIVNVWAVFRELAEHWTKLTDARAKKTARSGGGSQPKRTQPLPGVLQP